MSYDGKWVGRDGDVTMLLFRDGGLCMTFHSYAEFSKTGRYVLTRDQKIIPILKPGHPDFPMPWSLDNGSMVVMRPSKAEVFEAARAAGIDEELLTDSEYETAFHEFPYRQVEK